MNLSATRQVSESGVPDLGGARYTVRLVEVPPFATRNTSEKSGYFGLAAEMMAMMAAELNFTYEFVGPSSDGHYLQGAMDDVFFGNADVAIGPVPPSQAYFDQVDYTDSYYSSGLHLLTLVPSQTSASTINSSNLISWTDPFGAGLWGVVVGMITMYGIVMYYIEKGEADFEDQYALSLIKVDGKGVQEEIENTFTLLRNNTCQGAVLDEVIASVFLKNSSFCDVQMVGTVFAKTPYVLGIRKLVTVQDPAKQDMLQSFMDATAFFFAKIRDDGNMSMLHKKYIENDGSACPAASTSSGKISVAEVLGPLILLLVIAVSATAHITMSGGVSHRQRPSGGIRSAGKARWLKTGTPNIPPSEVGMAHLKVEIEDDQPARRDAETEEDGVRCRQPPARADSTSSSTESVNEDEDDPDFDDQATAAEAPDEEEGDIVMADKVLQRVKPQFLRSPSTR
eukprot:jgi/Tetstr1/448545/TSEL_035803.t2